MSRNSFQRSELMGNLMAFGLFVLVAQGSGLQSGGGKAAIEPQSITQPEASPDSHCKVGHALPGTEVGTNSQCPGAPAPPPPPPGVTQWGATLKRSSEKVHHIVAYAKQEIQGSYFLAYKEIAELLTFDLFHDQFEAFQGSLNRLELHLGRLELHLGRLVIVALSVAAVVIVAILAIGYRAHEAAQLAAERHTEAAQLAAERHTEAAQLAAERHTELTGLLNGLRSEISPVLRKKREYCCLATRTPPPSPPGPDDTENVPQNGGAPPTPPAAPPTPPAGAPDARAGSSVVRAAAAARAVFRRPSAAGPPQGLR